MKNLEELSQNIIRGNAEAVISIVEQMLSEIVSPEVILNDGLIAGMDIVGTKFKNGEYFIPNVLMAAKAMNSAIQILEPRLLEAGVKPKGKLLIGTVHGDLHDIGKTLVSIMFKGAGYQIIDLGTNVEGHEFVEAAKKESPDIIGMSALLTTTMLSMEVNIDLLRKADVTTPVIIGGAATSQPYANAINADFWAATASEAVDIVANHFLKQ